MRRGVIYRDDGSRQGEVSIAPIVSELKKIARVLRFLAYALIGLGVLGLIIIYAPLGEAEIKYEIKSRVLAPPPVPTALPAKPAWPVPDPNYSLYIPKLDAVSRVIPNVNAADEKSYQQALKLGVAAAAGLSSPGGRGTTYLFSHSVSNPINFARYNAVFYLLDRLVVGDDIEVVYLGKLTKYKVSGIEKLPPKDTKYLVPQQADEKLVLQTCWPPGTTLQRLYVIAKPVYNQNTPVRNP